MVFVVGITAALFLGLGWVLQQRIAAHAALSELLSVRLLWHLMGKPVWWLGIGSMVVGATLGGLALQLGSVALVEPLLSTSLLFAFVISAAAARQPVKRAEVGGALLLSSALGVFIAVGHPRSEPEPNPSLGTTLLVVIVVAGVVLMLIAAGKRQALALESALIAAAAGVLFGLQDASTSAALATVDRHGIAALLVQPWPYVVGASAAVGILLSQSAFRAARLDFSLPPMTAAEPVVGILLGVVVLGNRISVTVLSLTVEALCLVAMVVGIVLIARSASLVHPFAKHPAHRPPSAR